jgi:Phosphodiester glycosidase
VNRRFFLKTFALLGGSLIKDGIAIAKTKPVQTERQKWSHSSPNWKSISKGLDFATVDVNRGKEIIDSVAILRVQPKHNKIRVFHSFDYEKTVVRTLEEWQKETSALALISGAQYMADPYYMPCALVICDGKQKGPARNKNVRGMLLSEPKKSDLPHADLIDFDYDQFNPETTPYTQGIQHWPILLDRQGAIKVKPSEMRANRSVVAKAFDGNILFFTTQRASFTLYDFGAFLKDTNASADGGFHIHTAMNLDGGKEANMILRSEHFSFDSKPKVQANTTTDQKLFAWEVRLPGVIGIFPR